MCGGIEPPILQLAADTVDFSLSFLRRELYNLTKERPNIFQAVPLSYRFQTRYASYLVFKFDIKMIRKMGLEPTSAAPKNDDEVFRSRSAHWATSHSISFQLLTMTNKLHHRFWRHVFNLYNSVQSHHSPSLNLIEMF